MSAKIVGREGSMLKIEIAISLTGTMMEMEDKIQNGLNDAGSLATGEALKSFDTDGSPIQISGTKLTARKQKASQHDETPYGRISLERYLYQSNEGGYTYCPLEDGARILLTATPRFSKIVSESYAQTYAGQVVRNLLSHHHRSIDTSYVAKIADAVASVALAKEEVWDYDMLLPEETVSSISLSVDGAYVKLAEGSWREAMCGSISLYDKEGERLHTTYIAASPEHGKEQFHIKMDRLIKRTLERYPTARVSGLGDGAKDNWTFLGQYTDHLVLDFWHVSEYVHAASDAIWGGSKKKTKEKEQWEETWFHILKHEVGGAQKLLDELKEQKKKVSGKRVEKVEAAIKYIENHLELMNYAQEVECGSPIGSGVVESACKMIVKSRMCIAGAGWSLVGAGVVLTLRSIYKSDGQWDIFWSRVMRYGIPNSRSFGPSQDQQTPEHTAS